MNIKVGILSMQRVINYGSFLQAYALKSILENLGAECYFIDIEKGRQLKGNEVDSPVVSNTKRFFRIGINLLTKSKQTFLVQNYSQQIKLKFIDHYYGMLGLDRKFDRQFDLVAIGSDEVFNCTKKNRRGFSKQLFGDGINAKKIISYAASFGDTTIDSINKFKLSSELSQYLLSLNDISVRDDNSRSIIKKLIKEAPKMHLDPVLIYDFKKEMNKCKIKIQDYIIVYSYGNRIADSTEIDAICLFAKKYNKKLISIFCAYTWCNSFIIPDTPFDVLAYFRDADYIITDTFHGSIFSIINKKKFCTLIRNSNKQKITSLLNNLHLGDRLLEKTSNLETILTASISYKKIDQVLELERANTNKYLQDNF